MERVEQYSSDSGSDGELTHNVLDFARLELDSITLDYNLCEFCDDPKKSAAGVDSLYLHHNHLHSFPENIYRFTNLRSLDLSSNGLTVLPDIFQYCSLNTLIVKNNHLTDSSLPKSFTPSTLKELNLSGNRLTNFPEQVLDFPQLKYLYLGGNSIQSVSKNIWKLQSLQILYIGGNRLTEVPVSIGKLRLLQGLMLCDNLLESIPSEIADLHNLRSLLLHKNRIRTLPPEIVALKNLSELSLRDNPLVVRFVSDMTHNPASLLELSARCVKNNDINISKAEIPQTLKSYLESAHHCLNPKCQGVYFDNRIEHIKFVDFCGKYRIPLLQYLCTSKCITGEEGASSSIKPNLNYRLRKVLLG